MTTDKNSNLINREFSLFKRVKPIERASFAKELSLMLKSGLHLTQALNVFKDQLKNKHFGDIIDDLVVDLKEGRSLSSAMKKYPGVFDKVMVSVVEAGEASGTLAEQLKELGKQLEGEARFTSKIKGALIYPSFVLAVMLGVAILATVKIIPAIEGILRESSKTLPFATKVVLGVSGFIINHWLLLIFIIVVLVLGGWLFFRSPFGAYLLDSWLIREPSGLALRIYMTRMTRTLGMLVRAGVPIVSAVNIVSNVIGNQIFRQSLERASRQLEKGIPMSATFQTDRYIPEYVTQMLIVGEQTGQLDHILLNLADYYDVQSRDKISVLTSIFEPAIIVLIGLGVAFLVFAILVPIYNATTSI